MDQNKFDKKIDPSNDQPPPYGDLSGYVGHEQPQPPAPAVYQSHSQQPVVIVVEPIPYSKPDSAQKPRGCWASYWSSVADPLGWTSCLYFIFVSFPIGVFAFCWIVPTFVGALCSLLFPPVGYFICIATAWSWRALARIELVTVHICTRPSRVFSCSTYEPRFLPPVFSSSHEEMNHTWFTYGASIVFDRFTWMSFVYFVFVKSAICIITFAVATFLFSVSFPLMLCCMPVMCIVCRKMGMWQVSLAQCILVKT